MKEYADILALTLMTVIAIGVTGLVVAGLVTLYKNIKNK
jgi:preprotein translocase subunit Sss1